MKMTKRTLSLLVIFISVFYPMAQEKVKKHIEEGVEVIVNPIKPCPIKGEPTTLHLEKKFIGFDFIGDWYKRKKLVNQK